MKRKMITLLSLALLLTATGFGQGQEITGDHTFKASMQFRPRFEYRDGAFRPLSKNETAAALISSRLRLNMDYQYSDLLKTRISLQNVSLWGQANPAQGIKQQNNEIAIYEAWADLKIYKGFGARIGRQEILLDDQRLFSIADWTDGGRTHDALSLYYSGDKFQLKSFFAFNQNYNVWYHGDLHNPSGNLYNTTGAQAYKFMQTLWIGYQFSEASKASFLFANLGFQNADTGMPKPNTTIANLQTTGINYSFNKKAIQINLSAYYQFGKNMEHQDASAYLLSGGITGKINKALSFGLRSDYLSGNSLHQNEPTNHSFYSLFGTNHPFYGGMEYFPYSNVGLWNNVISANYSASSAIKLQAEGHLFYAAHKFERNGQLYNSNLGQEIDLKLNYTINSFVNLTMGYSGYFTNDNILALKGVSNATSLQNWVWVCLNVSPELFKTRF